MNIFEKVKPLVTAQDVAEKYGLERARTGLYHCPFHDDGTASMKAEERFFCFGCGAKGDAVDLYAGISGLSPVDAAIRLSHDFGIDSGKSPPGNAEKMKAYNQRFSLKRWHAKAMKTIVCYLRFLERCRDEFAPMDMDVEWHPLFCESLMKLSWAEYLWNKALECGKDELKDFYDCFGKEVDEIERRLERLEREAAFDDPGDKGQPAQENEWEH